jgi:hypothetical protein
MDHSPQRHGQVSARRRLRLGPIALLSATVALCSACTAPRGAPSPIESAGPCAVTTLDGTPAAPLQGRRGELALFVFLADGCPVARTLSPEIERIGREAIESGMRVALVYPDPFVKPGEVRAHNREFGLTLPTLLDPAHLVVAAVGASISPEAALIRFNADGGFDLLYRGRINDLYTAPGRRRPSATTRELAAAIQAVLEGRSPDPARTEAIGCVIEPLTAR